MVDNCEAICYKICSYQNWSFNVILIKQDNVYKTLCRCMYDNDVEAVTKIFNSDQLQNQHHLSFECSHTLFTNPKCYCRCEITYNNEVKENLK